MLNISKPLLGLMSMVYLFNPPMFTEKKKIKLILGYRMFLLKRVTLE